MSKWAGTTTSWKWLVILLGLCAFTAQAKVLSPYQAVYEVDYGSILLGDSTFTLTAAPKRGPHCFQMKGLANPMGLAALFTSPIHELSLFCLKGGRLQSQYYRIQQKGGHHGENYSLAFDWGNHLVITNGKTKRKLPRKGLDRIVMGLELRLQLEHDGGKLPSSPLVFMQVEDDEINPLVLAVKGHATITTNAGKFDAVRVDRIHSKKHEMHLWLAPKLDYLPVRMEFQHRGKTMKSLTLRTFKRLPPGTTADDLNNGKNEP